MRNQKESTDRPSRKTALVSQNFSRYNIDIAALSETCLAGKSSIKEELGGYKFYWRGLPKEEP